MAYTSQTPHRAALLVASVAVLGLLTACGNETGTQGSPQKVSGMAAPATGSPTTHDSAAGNTPAGAATPPPVQTGGEAAAGGASSPTPSSAGGTSATAGGGSRCHTSELSATVGGNNPGAGQENFPVVLTNKSSRTCTVRGFPGAAFVSAAGEQLGPDPRRSSGTPATVTLKPGQHAWAGLTFSNPEVSGARTATPAALLITPPDEQDPLKVAWTAGEVPVSGNASSVSLSVFAPGSGV
ncbi:DUF4232 domain-containing protein [Streptomyces sp. NPDC056161]|uniref:DUF4232 domain-containing protein n=1 Tax=Streptomyces sp. NPDC056161 TaxID=3345732 RepID=UPI0035DDE970